MKTKHTPHTEQGPFEVINLDSPFVFGIGRKCTPKELEQARKAGRFDEVPMSVLAITQDGVAGVMGEGTARLFAAAPDLLEALEVAKHMLGPHVIRSCGTCEKCGGHTPNGTLHICRKCGHEIIEAALAKAQPTPSDEE